MDEVFKLVILIAALVPCLVSSRWTLAVNVLFLPLARWLPQSTISGFNATNILLVPLILHAWAAGRSPGRDGRRDPLLFPAVALLGLVLVSLLRVQLDSRPIPQFVARNGFYTNALAYKEMVACFVLYWCARRLVREPRDLRVVLGWVAASYLIQAGSASMDLFRGVSHFAAAEGDLGHPNTLAAFLSAYMMIPVAVFLDHRNKWTVAATIPAIAISVLGILGTLSRGGLLAAGIVGVALALLRRNVAVILIALAVVSAPHWLPKTMIREFHGDAPKPRIDLSGVGVQPAETEQTENLRELIYRSGFRMVADAPFLGVGLGQYSYVIHRYGFPRRHSPTAHNVYLWLAAEVGIPAFLAHAAIMLIMLWVSLRLAFLRRHGLDRTFGLAMLGMTAAFVLNTMVHQAFYTTPLAGPFWVLAGATMNRYLSLEPLRRVRAKTPSRANEPGRPTTPHPA